MFIMPYLMREDDLCQGSANFSYKEPDSRYFRLCRQFGFCYSYSTPMLYEKVATDNTNT